MCFCTLKLYKKQENYVPKVIEEKMVLTFCLKSFYSRGCKCHLDPQHLYFNLTFLTQKSWSIFKCRKKVRSMKEEKMKRNRTKSWIRLIISDYYSLMQQQKSIGKVFYIFGGNDENHLREVGNVLIPSLQNVINS